MDKRENAGNQHFLFFPQCLIPSQKECQFLSHILSLSSANAFNLDRVKISSFGKKLTLHQTTKCYTAWSKLKAFADDKINMTQKLKFVSGRAENIVGKGENAGYQHFPFYHIFYPETIFHIWVMYKSSQRLTSFGIPWLMEIIIPWL